MTKRRTPALPQHLYDIFSITQTASRRPAFGRPVTSCPCGTTEAVEIPKTQAYRTGKALDAPRMPSANAPGTLKCARTYMMAETSVLRSGPSRDDRARRTRRSEAGPSASCATSPRSCGDPRELAESVKPSARPTSWSLARLLRPSNTHMLLTADAQLSGKAPHSQRGAPRFNPCRIHHSFPLPEAQGRAVASARLPGGARSEQTARSVSANPRASTAMPRRVPARRGRGRRSAS